MVPIFGWRGSDLSCDYDAIGQVTTFARSDGSSLDYVWDNARRLTSITENGGRKTEYTYDTMGNRLSTVTKDASGTITTFSESRTYLSPFWLAPKIRGERI